MTNGNKDANKEVDYDKMLEEALARPGVDQAMSIILRSKEIGKTQRSYTPKDFDKEPKDTLS